MLDLCVSFVPNYPNELPTVTFEETENISDEQEDDIQNIVKTSVSVSYFLCVVFSIHLFHRTGQKCLIFQIYHTHQSHTKKGRRVFGYAHDI